VNSKEENSQDICPNYIQEFGLCIYLSLWSPVGEVALDAEGGDLHGGLYDEDCREEVVEQLQGVLQFLPQKYFLH
jgi:hypothetical protein